MGGTEVLIMMAISSAVQYVGAQRQAKAMEQSAKSAEEMGKYNAQIEVNNMVAEQQDIAYAQRAEELKKSQALQKAQMERKAVTADLASKMAASKVKAPTFGGTFSDVFRAQEREGYDRLAAFDFGLSQETAGYSAAIKDADRQLGYAYQRGMASRDLTLRTAANQATQFRNKASSIRTQAFADLGSGLASAYYTKSSMDG